MHSIHSAFIISLQVHKTSCFSYISTFLVVMCHSPTPVHPTLLSTTSLAYPSTLKCWKPQLKVEICWSATVTSNTTHLKEIKKQIEIIYTNSAAAAATNLLQCLSPHVSVNYINFLIILTVNDATPFWCSHSPFLLSRSCKRKRWKKKYLVL